MANRTKYGRNRQLWRKVYADRRRKPETTSFVNTLSNETTTLDLHRTLRHRDFFIIKTTRPPTGVDLAEYDEGLVAFANSYSATANFSFCFSDTPDAVVLTVDSAGDFSDYIVPFGIVFNSCSMSIGLSAPFTGNVRYRAVYSTTGYPAFVTGSSAELLRISAGHLTASNVTAYTASFDLLSNPPTTFYRTPWDSFTNFANDVDLTLESSTQSTAIGEISAPLSGVIYFIGVQ